jgi:hypothetical protein
MGIYVEASIFDVLQWIIGAPLPDGAVAVLILLSLWVSALTNGAEHALIYSTGQGEPLGAPFGLHEIDLLQEWAYYSLMLLTGLPIVSAFGAAYSARVFFQGPINVAASGGWFIEPDQPVEFFGYEITKAFTGRARIAQCFLGLLAFSLPFLW